MSRLASECFTSVMPYTTVVPKLWDETIEAHRREVRDAILDTAWALVAERGPASVRMSEVAERTGIGRATLYKYFPDVESILSAWHHRQISRHLDQLVEARDKVAGSGARLRAVIETYARIHQRRGHHQRHHPHGTELATLLHPDEHVGRAVRQLHEFFRDVLREAAGEGVVRDDVSPDELASYCLHALTAAGTTRSAAATGRLVAVTLHGLGASVE